MRFGVVIFPGTWSDMDFHHVISQVLHQPVEYVWHRDTDVDRFDCLVLPGGFSYGDYLRAGAVAGRSPIVAALPGFVARGGLVLGSCNGFQILCEAGLLPGPSCATTASSSGASGPTLPWSRPRAPSPAGSVGAKC